MAASEISETFNFPKNSTFRKSKIDGKTYYYFTGNFFEYDMDDPIEFVYAHNYFTVKTRLNGILKVGQSVHSFGNALFNLYLNCFIEKV
jgi:hypothetical protein